MEDSPRLEGLQDAPAGDPGDATPGNGDAAGREVRLRINESKMTTGYANGFRSSLTRDEVVVDFGMNLPQPGPTQEGEAAVIHFDLQHRAVMNYATAKRLALSLSNAVRRYEQERGEIQLGG